MRVLLCWLGRTDLRASSGDKEVGFGPIASSLKDSDYDLIHLLSNYDEVDSSKYSEWINNFSDSKIEIENVKLSSPTDYGEIYEAATNTINSIYSHHGDIVDFTFHISPGTPAMAAVWIILSKTRFPARIIESSKEAGVKVVSLPFDISAEYIPDLLKKPDEKLLTLSQALPPEAPEFDEIIHRSSEMKRVIAKARWAAVRDIPVLIQGDSGTGKELLARAIHGSSVRNTKPFIAVNCGAIPDSLFESEFFGYTKGAFTGADRSKIGYFEAANGGTLFLDEVGELSVMSQVRLLRVLQEKLVTPLGATKPRQLDIRVLAATNRNLTDLVSNGKFRADLFHRLAVGYLHIPPLIARSGDTGLLIDHFINQLNQSLADQPNFVAKTLTPVAKQRLLDYKWPGNVRELYHTVLRIMTWSPSARITEQDVAESILTVETGQQSILGRPLGAGFDIRDVITEVVTHYFSKSLNEARGIKREAAKLVGLPNYQTFTNWMKKYQIRDRHTLTTEK